MDVLFQYLFAAALLQISLENLEIVCFLLTRDLNCFYHASALLHPLSREQHKWKNKEMNKEVDEILRTFSNNDGNGNENARKQ